MHGRLHSIKFHFGEKNDDEIDIECFDNLRSDRICGFLSKKRTNLQFEFRISDLSVRIETRGNVERETDSK